MTKVLVPVTNSLSSGSIQLLLDKINGSIVEEADIKQIVGVLRSGLLSKPDGGPIVAEFQKIIAELHNKKYAFAVNSGTSALHCAIVALSLLKDDEVIVPAFANIADCSTVLQEGGKPISALHPLSGARGQRISEAWIIRYHGRKAVEFHFLTRTLEMHFLLWGLNNSLWTFMCRHANV